MTQLSSDKDKEIETCLVEFRRVPLKGGKVSFTSLFDICSTSFQHVLGSLLHADTQFSHISSVCEVSSSLPLSSQR